MAFHPHQGGFRTLAKALLGAFLFLLVASFLVLPCMTAVPSELFSSVAGPQACQEHKLFKAQADLSRFDFLPPEGIFRFLTVLPAAFTAFAATAILVIAHARLRGSIRARFGTLPFVTSDPPRLPAFAALRDA
jgi:hypothetical protein